ncbi:zinc ABC transporter substrate-binding protein [Arthrobacter agilis]|uniref:zinc ABC transporter substrate-binding protein AztC n=1 Tax=Arthrobacter agilis TaxID=37921 RepID=UPI000B358004|nr:zinc ABC transporter substrate-binding protein AztC [Arthrobacter agilis]OUM42218.1 zinc ABC transporter substrate-binding protein [Arthrobacter agilis]PPB45561.1 zinc ABC transporter substrate-binding protein [Arthrobacter agilis]TPV26459.1 zinc ABC transporter substrate-binding protein [Arthrobacter agilis]VDR33640.1 Tromp-1 [Arthrobacter agilis]
MTAVTRALVLALTSAAVLTGCSAPASDRPVIVVTTNILGDVVQNVVGDEAEVRVLMQPNADPHSFEISAQDGAMMRDADLIVTNGLGLEEGLQQHIDSAQRAAVPVLVAGDVITALEYADGGSAGTQDPHFWTDPPLMADVVDELEQHTATIQGIDEASVADSAESYRTELTELDATMTEAFGKIPAAQRNLVTNHHVFGYLAERYGFRIIGAVIPGGTTLASPSASDLRDLVAAIEEAQVTTIFAESSQPDRLVQVLADGADLEVDVVELFTESLTNPGEGADTYLAMMRTNTERIAAGLSP